MSSPSASVLGSTTTQQPTSSSSSASSSPSSSALSTSSSSSSTAAAAAATATATATAAAAATPSGTTAYAEERSHKRRTVVFYQPTRTSTVPDTTVDKQQQGNLMYSPRESDLLQDIFHFFITKCPSVLPQFFNLCENKDQWEDIADSLLTMTFARSTTLPFVRYFIQAEFEQHSASYPGSLFRENSIATKIIKSYLRKVGSKYLTDILGPTLHEICITDRKLTYEVDPSKVENPEEIETNKSLLLAKVESFLTKLTSTSNIDKMPPGIKIIALFFSELSKQYYPDINFLPIVGSFLMLRYFNPPIFSPEQYGLLPKGKAASPKTRRNLILITKVLQNLSNGNTFKGKEAFMQCLNAYITEKAPVLHGYFKQILAAASTTSTNLVIDSDLCVVSVKDLHLLHMLLSQHKVALLTHVTVDRRELEEKIDALGSYSSKVSFASTLAAAEQKHVKEMLTQRQEEASYIGWLTISKTKSVVKKIILIIGMNRIFTMKKGGKLLKEGHSLDLVELSSNTPTEVKLVFKSFEISGETDQADEIIFCIRRAFLYNFSGIPEEFRFKLNITPVSRIETIDAPGLAICGGFVGTYKAMCNYHNVPVNSSLCWDIENLYSNNRNFDISCFFSDEVEEPTNIVATSLMATATSYLVPILQAIWHNSYFLSLVIKDTKVDKALGALSEMLRLNNTLTSLSLVNVSLSDRGFTTLFEAMANNQQCIIESIDISDNNYLEDKALTALGLYLVSTQAPKGIISLNMSNICSNTKAWISFATALFSSFKMKGSCHICQLDISHNRFGDAITQISQWLASGQHTLKYLNVGYTSVTGQKLMNLLSSIAKGCRSLTTLELGALKMSKIEESSNITQLMGTLTELNLSGSIGTHAVLQDILQATPKEGSMKLNVSTNSIPISGAQLLNTIAPKLTGVTHIDLADSDLGDDGITLLVEGLLINTTLNSLNINSSFGFSKASKRDAMIKAMCKLAASDCPIETLKMAGGPKNTQQLGRHILPFIQSLAHNKSMNEIDISGHQFGNNGAIALSKTLQLNTALSTIYWDDNLTGVMGLTAINQSLRVNQTVRCMPLPVNDITLLITGGVTGIPEEIKRNVKTLSAEIQQAVISHANM
ncbi:RasGTPase-activating protein [Pelomyxa schiedti]|nr:RasGTPase-activating protein [Pelomyxa schiedti]